MDREVWQATVRGVTRVGHDCAMKPLSPLCAVSLLSTLRTEKLLADYFERNGGKQFKRTRRKLLSSQTLPFNPNF